MTAYNLYSHGQMCVTDKFRDTFDQMSWPKEKPCRRKTCLFYKTSKCFEFQTGRDATRCNWYEKK